MALFRLNWKTYEKQDRGDFTLRVSFRKYTVRDKIHDVRIMNVSRGRATLLTNSPRCHQSCPLII